MEYDYYRYTVAVSPFPPCFYPLPPLVVSIQWHFSGETNPLRDGQISTICDIRAALPERGEAAGMATMMGLTKKKKKKKKDQTVFQSPPSPSFLWKSKNWACDLCFRCFWALYYTISKHIQSTYLVILFLAFIASCKTGDKVYILIETHQFTGKKFFAITEFTF